MLVAVVFVRMQEVECSELLVFVSDRVWMERAMTPLVRVTE